MEVSESTITETDRAWAAGFFDADGSSSVGRSGELRADGTYRQTVRCQLGQAERQWSDLERFATIVGCGRITLKGPRTDKRPHVSTVNWTPYKNWQAQSLNDVATCMNILWPYLGSYKRLRWEKCWEKARASRTPNGAGVKSAPSK